MTENQAPDRLLVAVQSREVRDASATAVGGLLNLIRDELPAEFMEGDGFQPGKLLDSVARLDEASGQRRKALQLAERILPTRWSRAPQYSQAFFAGAIRLFQRDTEMRNIIVQDKEARDKAIRHYFNRAMREARGGAVA